MVAVEFIHDGWIRRSVGAKGVILRRNPEHVERCVRAIRNRYEDEVEITYEQKSKVVPLQLKRKV